LLEQLANLLEAGELVPMYEPPSAKVFALKTETPNNCAELRRLLILWHDTLMSAVKRTACRS